MAYKTEIYRLLNSVQFCGTSAYISIWNLCNLSAVRPIYYLEVSFKLWLNENYSDSRVDLFEHAKTLFFILKLLKSRHRRPFTKLDHWTLYQRKIFPQNYNGNILSEHLCVTLFLYRSVFSWDKRDQFVWVVRDTSE